MRKSKLFLLVMVIAAVWGCSKSSTAPEMVTVIAVNPYGEVVGDTTYYFSPAVINGVQTDTVEVAAGTRLIAVSERTEYIGGAGLVDSIRVFDTTMARAGVWQLQYK